MLNLFINGRKNRWALVGFGLGLLTAPAFQASAAVTYSSVFTFDQSITSGGVVASGDSLFGTVTNSSLTYGLDLQGQCHRWCAADRLSAQ